MSRTVELPIDDIVWNPTIYPRKKWSTSTIDRYADAMRGGAQFPPVIVDADTLELYDGKHRLEAAKKLAGELGQNGDATILAERVHVPEQPDGSDLPDDLWRSLFAASLSSKHGDRIAASEAKTLARAVYEANPDYQAQEVAALLSVSPSRISEWASDITARRREERRAKAVRLTRLGWTQQQAADVLGVDQGQISRDMQNFQLEEMHTLMAQGHTPSTVAERFGIGETLAWAIKLDGLDDPARFEQLAIKLQPYDVWNFQSCHDLMGDTHPGRIPGELVAHVIYFYSELGDIIIDPMGGSGTTPDACLLLGRKCFAYDIDSRHERPDIIPHDLAEGWPDTVGKADLIFWDPPYFKKKDALVDAGGYIDGSISRLDAPGYLDFFRSRLAEGAQAVKPSCRLAFVMSDWDGENWTGKPGEDDQIHIGHYIDVLRDAGWRLRRHIQAPLPTQQVHADIVNKFRASRRLARLERYVLICEVA